MTAGQATSEGRMDWRSSIIANRDVLVGKPVIKGSRISVELLDNVETATRVA